MPCRIPCVCHLDLGGSKVHERGCRQLCPLTLRLGLGNTGFRVIQYHRGQLLFCLRVSACSSSRICFQAGTRGPVDSTELSRPVSCRHLSARSRRASRGPNYFSSSWSIIGGDEARHFCRHDEARHFCRSGETLNQAMLRSDEERYETDASSHDAYPISGIGSTSSNLTTYIRLTNALNRH